MRINCFLMLLGLFFANNVYSQGCCSGGSASPIAGGISQGVLNKNQLEIAPNFQHDQSNKFFARDRDTTAMFHKLSSNYLYTRVAFGLSEKLTISLEAGYFINRMQIGLNNVDTIRSSGIGDLIVFPRYEVYKKSTARKNIELVVGLGLKIPIGSNNDSTVIYTDPISSKEYYQIAPPTVQSTNGSHDFIFYSFFFNNYLTKKVRVFANSVYVLKGWNSLGQKFGDYASVSLFVSKTVFKRLGITAQLKGEWVGKMQTDKLVDMVAFYNIYPQSSGGRKLFITPQISYGYKNFTAFALSDIPLYQYLNGSQVGSQFQITTGISYKINYVKGKTTE